MDPKADIVMFLRCRSQDGINLARYKMIEHGLPLASLEQYQALFTASRNDKANRELSRQKQVFLERLIEEIAFAPADVRANHARTDIVDTPGEDGEHPEG